MDAAEKWALRGAMVAVLVVLCAPFAAAGCGARSEILAPEADGAGGEDPGTTGTEERACLPNCNIGHLCCVGGCDGPAAETVNDCCACLPGEVNSNECPGFDCGG
ncbi:MAG: hypothetical protein R3B70_11490 [Polyangiaceae bacterium]